MSIEKCVPLARSILIQNSRNSGTTIIIYIIYTASNKIEIGVYAMVRIQSTASHRRAKVQRVMLTKSRRHDAGVYVTHLRK